MTDEIFITKLLDKHYRVGVNTDWYCIYSIEDKKPLTLIEFKREFKNLIPSTITSERIINEWFHNNSFKLESNLNDSMSKMDFSKGSIELMSELNEKFNSNTGYFGSYITQKFTQYYYDKYFIPYIHKIFSNFTINRNKFGWVIEYEGRDVSSFIKAKEVFNKETDQILFKIHILYEKWVEDMKIEYTEKEMNLN